MSMEVLQTKAEIGSARTCLREMGADAADSSLVAWLKRKRLLPGIPLGDQVKSWDVWKTVFHIQANLPKDAPVLDLGAYACEVLPALHRLGFRSLTGIDLNTSLPNMPFGQSVTYQVGNFLETAVPDASFSAITAISVIEHGYQPQRLLAEVSRLLKPGGFFLASIDYWPAKIDTSGITVFGLDWLIFSQTDVEALFAMAADYGLEAVGDMRPAAGDALINWQSRSYTFAWIALRKR